jgi:chemotaxis protein histidine kinase CheA
VVQNHNGQLQINTSPDKGTTVQVLLPLHPDRGEAILPSLVLRYRGLLVDNQDSHGRS